MTARPYLRAALWSTLTLGAGFGAFNLLVIHWPLPLSMPPSHHSTHSGFQVWAFAFLPLAAAWLGERRAPGTVVLTIVGQLLTAYGRVGLLLPGTAPAGLAGALLQAAAVLGVVGRVAWTSPCAAVGSAGWTLAAAFGVAGGIQGLLEGDAEAAVAWNQAIYASALFGGAFPWMLGLLPPERPRLATPALALAAAGTALLVAGGLRIGRPGAFGLIDAGLLGVALAVAVLSVAVRSGAAGGAHLFALVGSTTAILDLARGAPGLFFDAARHAYTLGVVTPVVLALSARLARTEVPRGALGLVLAGAVLRETQVLASLTGSAACLKVSALSGIPAFAGILLAATAILRALRPQSPAPSGR